MKSVEFDQIKKKSPVVEKKINLRKSLYISSSNKLNVDIPGLSPDLDH